MIISELASPVPAVLDGLNPLEEATLEGSDPEISRLLDSKRLDSELSKQKLRLSLIQLTAHLYHRGVLAEITCLQRGENSRL